MTDADSQTALPDSRRDSAIGHLHRAESGALAPDSIAECTPLPVRSAAVVGGGTMGSSIAYLLQRSGVRVEIAEVDSHAAASAETLISGLFKSAVDRELLSPDDAQRGERSITTVVGCENLSPADLAIEAVIEDESAKKSVFAALQRCMPESAVLATNTSYLDVNEIASVLDDRGRVVGLHFFNPAHMMKLLEIIRTDDVRDNVLMTAFALAARVRKVPVLAKVCDGFIGNRILARYRESANMMLIEGACPYQIDRAMVDFGYRMGPYEVQDLAGIDIAYANLKRKIPGRGALGGSFRMLGTLVRMGRLGKKAKAGWYRYPGGGLKAQDPEVEALIVSESRRARVRRRSFAPDEIRTRLVCVMIDEACSILDEGIARSASDVDLVSVYGYGFPRWRGGLMYYADQIGAKQVLRCIERSCAQDLGAREPSAGLLKVCDAGSGFSDYYSALGSDQQIRP